MIKKYLLFLLFLNLTVTEKILPQNFVQESLTPFEVITGDTVFYDDFENGLNDWTGLNLGNPAIPSLWRLTEIKFVSPGHSIGWNDSLTNSYPHLSYEALISPSILIPSNAKVYLSVDLFIHLAPIGTNSSDFFDIEITTDNGATWNNFSQYAYSGQQIGWKNFPADFSPGETGDLTGYAGENIRIRFIISTDNLDPNGEGVFIDNFRIIKVDCEFTDQYEPNNNLSQATPFIIGQTINAALCPLGDLDFYSFTVSQNDRINIVTTHNIFQIKLDLFNPSGILVASTGNKQLSYNAATGGVYKLKVSLSDIFSHTPDYTLYINVINTKPDIISVIDIPEDEGLQVRVQWQYSLFDPPDSISTIEKYHLFRKVDDTSGTGSKIISEDALKADRDFTGEIIFLESEYWDYVATIPAISPRPFTNYIYTAPTLKDNNETTFMVAAVSINPNQPVLWGAEGTGISYDNISPQFVNYSVAAGTYGITLNWEINRDIYTDVEGIKIYKGMFERFAPESSSMIASLNPASINFTDEQITPGELYYYKIAVSDFTGNITYTETLSGTVTSISEGNILPQQIYLHQNYPNPFNPVTIIEFSLPTRKNISLKIYDLLGREIIELAKGNFAPGVYNIQFDAGGLPSGIYFYTLTTSDFSETRKLTLIK